MGGYSLPNLGGTLRHRRRRHREDVGVVFGRDFGHQGSPGLLVANGAQLLFASRARAARVATHRLFNQQSTITSSSAAFIQ